ncbi:MAG TPA: c-type cytochrome [Xanthobacteraceae bacterium]|nr:c-type cytochrome [Xanthobacteraceae bacterium]
MVAFSVTGATYAKDLETVAVPESELQAKIAYCENCHGVSARGFHGFYPIPRLAGQQPEYLENQLQAFIEHRRTNNIMFNVSHVLGAQMSDTLAKHFHSLDPKPLITPAPADLISEGKKIYEGGIEKSDVPACAGCHSPDAKGQGQFPRLAGQLSDYIFSKLANWARERGQNPTNPDSSAIMAPIAHNLTEQQIKSVAAYLNQLE